MGEAQSEPEGSCREGGLGCDCGVGGAGVGVMGSYERVEF